MEDFGSLPSSSDFVPFTLCFRSSYLLLFLSLLYILSPVLEMAKTVANLFFFFCLVSGDENWFSSLSSRFSVTSLLSLSLFFFFFFVCVCFSPLVRLCFSPGSFFRPPGVSSVFFFFLPFSALPFIEPESLPKPVPVAVLHLQDC